MKKKKERKKMKKISVSSHLKENMNKKDQGT